MAPKWYQNLSRIVPLGSEAALWEPCRATSLFLTFCWCHFGVHFGRFGLHFSIKNRCGNQCKKRCRKSNENGAKNEESLSKSDPKVDQKTKVFLQWWFCEKCCFTARKPCFLRLQVSKNQWEIYQNSMQKRCLETWSKITQKWSQNGPKWGAEMTQNGFKTCSKMHRKIRSKIDAKKKPEGIRENVQPAEPGRHILVYLYTCILCYLVTKRN